jgi:hypothetical protein
MGGEVITHENYPGINKCSELTRKEKSCLKLKKSFVFTEYLSGCIIVFIKKHGFGKRMVTQAIGPLNLLTERDLVYFGSHVPAKGPQHCAIGM